MSAQSAAAPAVSTVMSGGSGDKGALMRHIPPRNCPRCGQPVTYRQSTMTGRVIPRTMCSNGCVWRVPRHGTPQHLHIDEARDRARAVALTTADTGDTEALDDALAQYFAVLADAAVRPVWDTDITRWDTDITRATPGGQP